MFTSNRRKFGLRLRTFIVAFVAVMVVIPLIGGSTASAQSEGDDRREDRSDANGPSDAGGQHPDDDGSAEEPDVEEPDVEATGLGFYGTSGPIARSMLPDGIDEYVSEEAIQVAQADMFRAARSTWSSEIDFVDQVDYQITYRRNSGFLDSSQSHIAQVLADRPDNDAVDELRLYLTDTEWGEIAKREERGDVAARVEDALRRSTILAGNEADFASWQRPARSTFVGSWVDPAGGGLVVASKGSLSGRDRAEVRKLTKGVPVKFVSQAYSDNEIQLFKGILAEELRSLGIAFAVRVESDSSGRHIEVEVADPDGLPASLATAVPADAFSVLQGQGVVKAGSPASTHSWSDQQPGLAIWVADTFDDNVHDPSYGRCTWGHNGHTASYNYIITAGHCLGTAHQNFWGWAGSSVEIYQNSDFSTRNITPGSVYVAAETSWDANAAYRTDAARILSGYANDNCYHGSGSTSSAHCRWPMADRASHNSWEVNSDQTCASLGRSNTYRCAYIREENAETTFSTRVVRIDKISQPGDSGSGMKWVYTIDGILIEEDGSNTYFTTAYDVQRRIGMNFNCANGKQVKNPSEWSNCPIKNR